MLVHRCVGPGLPPYVDTPDGKVQARIHRMLDIGVGVGFGSIGIDGLYHLVIVVVLERTVQQREAVGVRLVCVHEVLAGLEEVVAVVRTLGGVEQGAPVDVADGAVCPRQGQGGPVVHGVLDSPDGLFGILICDHIELLEVVKQAVVAGVDDVAGQCDDLLEICLVDVGHGVVGGVLAISLVKVHLGGVSLGDILVGAALVLEGCREHLGGFLQVGSYLAEYLIAGELVVTDVHVIDLLHRLVDPGNLVEVTAQLEIIVGAEHLHLSLEILKFGDLGRVAGLEDLEGGVGALDRLVECLPPSVERTMRGIDDIGLDHVEVGIVRRTAAAFIGIVGMEFTLKPMVDGRAHGTERGIGTCESGVGCIHQISYTLA